MSASRWCAAKTSTNEALSQEVQTKPPAASCPEYPEYGNLPAARQPVGGALPRPAPTRRCHRKCKRNLQQHPASCPEYPAYGNLPAACQPVGGVLAMPALGRSNFALPVHAPAAAWLGSADCRLQWADLEGWPPTLQKAQSRCRRSLRQLQCLWRATDWHVKIDQYDAIEAKS
eukprot:1161833-Pelagomonas_calceolata.AAC.4